ncbi:MAG: hypothetical protein HXS47_06585 [Theionarchaea archaeon]|nr:hypothetical protein [Theionarchaea archaeon]
MRKALACGLIVSILLSLCNVPAISEEPDSDSLYREYRNDLVNLESAVHALLHEINTGKNPQSVYEHLLQVTLQAATLRGTLYPASQSLQDTMHISLQSYLEILLDPELSNQYLLEWQEKGYTQEEIEHILKWILYYNDFSYHSARGFSPEQRAWFSSAGLTESDIEELQHHITSTYEDPRTTQEMVTLGQEQLLTIQLSLSVATIQTLREIEKGGNKSKNEIKNKRGDEGKIDHLLRVEGDLTGMYEHPMTHLSLEHVKARSHQMIKAAEQVILSGSPEYCIDFFIALQIHCAAVTALSGDPERGINEFLRYELALQECAGSPERLSLQSSDISSSLSPPSHSPANLGNLVGNVEEWHEENNLAVVYILAKIPDTSWMEYITMISSVAFGSGSGASFSLSSLADALAGLFGGVTVTVAAVGIGVVGSIFLLIMSAEPVGYEWPPYVPGWNGTDYVIVIVDGSYGQGHIVARAQSDQDPCIRSSHQAILDDKYMISKIIYNAKKIFYNPDTMQYIYYYIENGKEWVVFTKKYGNTGFHELRTAYRADCPGPFKCTTDQKYYDSLINKWICEGFKHIN